MSRTVVQALLPHCALAHDRVCGISHQRERRNFFTQRVDPLYPGDERACAFVHLFTRRDVPVRCHRVEVGMPQAHDAIGVTCEEPGLVLCVSCCQLLAYHVE